MATTRLDWNEEDDEVITATYTGSGDGDITLSSAPNEGLDRQREVTVTAGDKTACLCVSQPGLREELSTRDGKVLYTSDGLLLTVLK